MIQRLIAFLRGMSFPGNRFLTLLTWLGHKVVPSGRYVDAPYRLPTDPPSGGSFSVAAGGPSSASVGSRPPSAALGAPP